MTISRRQFLGCSAALPFLFQELVEAQRKRVKIRDVQVMMLQGASRTYTLVKIVADDGLHGIAEEPVNRAILEIGRASCRERVL